MDMKIELVNVPVSDIDRAKAFYVDQVGFIADHDHRVDDELRFVQLTPPGSACSICFVSTFDEMPVGGQRGLLMAVDDAAAAREALLAKGVDASDIDHQDWGTFVYFADPDGNTWSLQQKPEWNE